MRLAVAVLLALSLPLAAAQEEKGKDLVRLSTLEIIRGEVVGFEPSGTLSVRDDATGAVRQIPVDEIVEVRFAAASGSGTEGKSERMILRGGGVLTGRVAGFEKDRFRVEAELGAFDVSRDEVKTVHLRDLTVTFPDPPEGNGDLFVVETPAEEGGEATSSARYGKLVSLDGKECVLGIGVKQETFPRSSLCWIFLEGAARREESGRGWFARLMLRGGDCSVGTLRVIRGDTIDFFSHALGRMSVKREQVEGILFVPSAQVSPGSLMVCDQRGVSEIDWKGNKLWEFRQGVNYCWSAKRTGRGTVVIANTNYNRVMEVVPATGEIVWELDGVSYPYDVTPMRNGNILVAEYYGNRVAEYDRRTKSMVWQTTKTRYPISCQELENGNILVSSNREVVELERRGDKEEREAWRLGVAGVRPWRANRLANGNTLIVDFQDGQVVEVDREGRRIVWKKEGLERPCNAFRLDDGNTVILEQRKGRIIEVDMAGRVVREAGGLSYPQNMSLVE